MKDGIRRILWVWYQGRMAFFFMFEVYGQLISIANTTISILASCTKLVSCMSQTLFSASLKHQESVISSIQVRILGSRLSVYEDHIHDITILFKTIKCKEQIQISILTPHGLKHLNPESLAGILYRQHTPDIAMVRQDMMHQGFNILRMYNLNATMAD